MPLEGIITNLPDFSIEKIEGHNPVHIFADYKGELICPFCGKTHLRKKAKYSRVLKHETFGKRISFLHLTALILPGFYGEPVKS